MQQALYPAIKPYTQHHITVDSDHILYVEECGTPSGLPILFVHGGPGAGCTVEDRRFFDPERYRIILFDQRGCGRSTPHGSLENNTTSDLIRDIETIREALAIQCWILFGGSWGSTLSLLYAQSHPDRVMGMILRGIFLCREQEMQWFFQPGGTSRIFPDYWEEFTSFIPQAEQENLIQAYYNRLNSKDELMQMAAAKRWAQWEAQCATLQPCQSIVERFLEPHMALSLAKIETHYFLNHIFIESNQILENMHRLEKIPGIIVHGRYDMICPIDNAFDLHHRWPNSELHIIREAGHSSMEHCISTALVNATVLMARHHA